jgi:hypothetical protein
VTVTVQTTRDGTDRHHVSPYNSIWCIVIGGLDNTVTMGINSALARSSDTAGILDKKVDYIPADAAINDPGNSGSPLVDVWKLAKSSESIHASGSTWKGVSFCYSDKQGL